MFTPEHASIADDARLDAVRWIGEAILNMDASFDRVTRLLSHMTGAPLAAFSLVGLEKQFLPSAFGVEELEDNDNVGDAFSRACIESGDLLVVNDAMSDFRFADSEMVMGAPYIRFYAGMTVQAPNGMPVGTLFVLDTKPREFSDDDLAAFADLRAQLEEMILLRTLSVRDPGTGLYNRRYFEELLEREYRRSARNSLPLTYISVDIDRFGSYNDECGALAGEHAIKAVSAALQECFGRGGDVVARIGGATFAILLPDTNPAGAELMAERCRVSVEDLDLAHDGAPDGLLTISLGVVAGVPVPEVGGVDALVKLADAALGRAKSAGRDRAEHVVLGEDTP
ncbi:sensor domain-containing diguanylate cyclase [Sporichthya sp.]|uniref:sensor domain-containing diguanylate cyclase n=1 Tax=Sporichthya sp. TaxID=65475 RepID=UPI0018202220|nr:sensor domain-containing diguanylate cyclase [Sporichthya sp.]MBA3742036.1 sensor domain-containing diguanylate cyclase [Sporichthya sp.]